MAHIVIDSCPGAGAGRECSGEALEAAAIASLERLHQITVVGDESEITLALQRIAHDAEHLRVVHAADRIDPEQDLRTALARAPRSSVVVGMELLARDPAAIFVSAGGPGAIVTAALATLQRIPSVSRAALAAVYPTLRPHGPASDPFALLLDVGATVSCTSDDLVTFAAMGAAYAAKISRLERPRVALLSNGASTSSAPQRIRDAHRQLQHSQPGFEYIGCLRADHVTSGDADVVVTDGFTGDVLLRTLEGIAATAEALIQRAAERIQWRVGVRMLADGITAVREFTDWENYGGAPLLGLDRAVIVTQANSGRRAFLNAIRLGAKIDRLQVLDAVAAGVAAMRSKLAEGVAEGVADPVADPVARDLEEPAS